MNLKKIHIGSLVKSKVDEHSMPVERIMKFFSCTEEEIGEMYSQESMDTLKLLRWSKLLSFDFFRIYTGHLVLYSPPTRKDKAVKVGNSKIEFRKSIYTEEVKNFVLNKIKTGKLTSGEVVARYRIPKTTLYKWMKKQ
ncbi:transposase [Chryseobacterium sp. L7]|uniref:Transposase n=1 Tax=Chryseobacterium endalhagicum TaxID=2797638 RepID=A0ABS1QH35_9FLAO|nr:transposase [Chryseobacterium endalhagicum]MBL1221918.1 transposase [Chryseobacterium endalhagicum]